MIGDEDVVRVRMLLELLVFLQGLECITWIISQSVMLRC